MPFRRLLRQEALLICLLAGSAFGQTATEHLRAAESHLRAGRLSEALASCRAAHRLSPSDSVVCAALVRASRAVLWMNPEDGDALHGLSDGLVGLGRCEDAVRVCRRALLLKSDDVEAHVALGDALACAGDRDGAAAAYRVALRADLKAERALRGWAEASRRTAGTRPEDADARALFAQALAALGLADSALAVCREAVRLNPEHVEALCLYGDLLTGQGRPEEALRAYADAVRLAPDCAEGFYGIGNLKRAAGRLEEAVSAYRRAVEARPVYGAAHVNLGNAYRGMGRFEEAVSAYREAIRARPDFSGSYYNLGVVLAQQGRWGEAEEAFRSALRAAPDDPRFRQGLEVAEARRQGEERARGAGRVRLAMAAFPSRAEGEGFLARVRGGGAFQGRDLGFVLPSDLDARFVGAIQGLKVGEVSGVVETEKGCFVFKRTE